MSGDRREPFEVDQRVSGDGVGSDSGGGEVRRGWRADRGMALMLVLVFMALFLSVAGALVLMTSMEARMAGAERARQGTRGAAEVALEWALQELARAADWNSILTGVTASSLVEPPAGGVADWAALDLTALTDRLQREADASNQWGPDRQVWRLFAAGPLDALLGVLGAGGREPLPYAVAWVADDPGDGDGDPGADANGYVTVRAEAFGSFHSRQVLVATVRRRGAGLELVSWREPEGG